MSPEPTTIDLVYTAVRDLSIEVRAMNDRLSGEVSSMKTEGARVEGRVSALEHNLMNLQIKGSDYITHSEMRDQYPSRKELQAASQSRFRFALPLLLGILIGLPGYVHLVLSVT
jgi:hypothetical protein